MTLQNVPAFSSSQIAPVVGACENAPEANPWGVAPPGVTTCATAGEVAINNARVNATGFMGLTTPNQSKKFDGQPLVRRLAVA
jgi:hypothetical protein